jgi:hypothetical protein
MSSDVSKLTFGVDSFVGLKLGCWFVFCVRLERDDLEEEDEFVFVFALVLVLEGILDGDETLGAMLGTSLCYVEFEISTLQYFSLDDSLKIEAVFEKDDRCWQWN